MASSKGGSLMSRPSISTILFFVLVLSTGRTGLGNESSRPSQESVAKDESVQFHFVKPQGLHISWSSKRDGKYDSPAVVAPAAYDFSPGKHEFKLTDIPGRPGVVLYPSVTIPPIDVKARDFVSEARVPIRFTEEDFDQVLTGNLVTKVLFLPDPEFAELALAGVETLISTRLDPGVDPIKEADRQGTVVAIIRLGNRKKEKSPAGPRKAATSQSSKAKTHQRVAKPGIAELTQASRVHDKCQISALHQIVSQDGNAEDEQIRAFRAGKGRWEFLDTPLEDVVDYVMELGQVKIVLDEQVDGQETVGFRGKTSQGVMLTEMLRPMGLTYRAEGGVILITPQDTKAYSARLLKRAEDEKRHKEMQAKVEDWLKQVTEQVIRDRSGWVESVTISAKNVTDSDLRPLANLRRLQRLTLIDTKMTDAGLRHLRDMKSLFSLRIKGSDMTGEGVIELKDCPLLYFLRFEGTKITSEGLKAVAQLKQLKVLALRAAPITDDGLVLLKALPDLERLDLADTQITNEGLAHLKALPELRRVNLSGTRITDDGLKHLKPLRLLSDLDLSNTEITDAGLKHLGPRRLRHLRYENTKITPAAVREVVFDPFGGGN
jgi:hypothetical protein